MKQLYFKSIILAILSFWGIKASAYDCEVDGIYYDLDYAAKTARVTFQSRQNFYQDYYFYSSDYAGAIMIPSSITYEEISYKVTSIGGNAFKGCESLTSVTIPNSVTNIYYQAFDGCRGLSSVTIEDGTKTLSFEYYYRNVSGDYTYISDYFNECPIETLYLGRNINYSTSSYSLRHPFANNPSLTTVIIGNSVTSIRENAFSNCSGLTSVTIGNSVTSIGDGAFKDCPSLTSLSIGNSVTTIGVGAFYGCENLTAVTIPNSVTSIGENAFNGCI